MMPWNSMKIAPKYQRLVIEFDKGEDPDDAYSSVAYEKGSNLLLHLGEYRRTSVKDGFRSNDVILYCPGTERTLGGLDVFLAVH